MRKNNLLFRIFVPAMFLSVFFAIIFASLALCITYQKDLGNINMRSPLAIFFVLTILIAIVIPVVFAILLKDLKITRTKRDLVTSKIAAAFMIIAIGAYETADIVYLLRTGFDAWRFLRIFLALLFILHLFFIILPSKTKIAPLIRHCANAAGPLYTVTSILAIYFWGAAEPIPEYFEILFIMSYSLITLFLLFDFKWRLVPTNPRAYVALSAMAFVFSCTISVASLWGVIVRRDIFNNEQIFIAIFEMLLIFTFSIYSLSKTHAIGATIAHIVKSKKKELEK